MDISKIDCDMYWNTSGAYNSSISLICRILDVGYKYVWVQIYGNLSPTPVQVSSLTENPLYNVTNKSAYKKYMEVFNSKKG